MNIESWCTVELNAKQDWTRANRKHNPDGFASSVFKGDSNQHHDSRLDFATAVPQQRKEKRHFPEKNRSLMQGQVSKDEKK
ncbi:Protein SPATA45-like [Exaiptasia diaphana]|nr:Protein SPATA45-like [Exaiptasia diaphana]